MKTLVLLGDSPEQLARAVLEYLVLTLSRLRTISAGCAAELLGMERFAIMYVGEGPAGAIGAIKAIKAIKAII